MKGFIKSKKGLVLLATLVVAAAAAVGAYAYFSSTGTGTGSATVGSSTAFVVTETAQSGGPLYPDGSIGTGAGHNVQTNTYTVNNPSAGKQNLNQVVIKIANANGSAWSSQTNALKPACTASDFSVGGQAVGSAWTDTSLAADLTAGQTVTGHVTVEMIDDGANQDNCQGVTVPLYYSAS
jgi:hypothetical protein